MQKADIQPQFDLPEQVHADRLPAPDQHETSEQTTPTQPQLRNPEIPELITAPPADLPSAPRKPHLFQPGVSGNPSGRPKRTQEEKDALQAIRDLAPDAVEKLKALLNSTRASPAVKVRIIELILDRTYGKAESAVKVTSVAETVQQSESYIMALVEKVREDME